MNSDPHPSDGNPPPPNASGAPSAPPTSPTWSVSPAAHPAKPLPLEGPAPVQESGRIETLDLLRGVAVLGILVMNIQSFAMIAEAYENPTAYGDLTGWNYATWFIGYLFFDSKFFTIFSILFGAGIVLMSERLESRGASPFGVHARRMLVLLGIGMIHAYGLWYGDILVTYAVCGFIVYGLRKWKPRNQIILAVCLMMVPFLIITALYLTLPMMGDAEMQQFQDEWAPPPEMIDAQLKAYRGNWLDQMSHRAVYTLFVQFIAFPFGIGWGTGGIMLLGMALYRLGVLSGRCSNRVYLFLLVIGSLVGLPVVYYGLRQCEASGWSFRYAGLIGSMFNYWAAPIVSLGWISAIILLDRMSVLRRLKRALTATGRMALTNYLVQTVICTFIFYGHGLGYFGYWSRFQQLGVVLGVWVFQLIVSPMWMRAFRFGPVEWAWRSLTYGQAQPMRRASQAPDD